MAEDLVEELKNVKRFNLDGYTHKKIIGRGGYGVVYLAKKDSHCIIVKDYYSKNTPEYLKSIRREIINLSQFQDPKLIVPFLGISDLDFEGKKLEIPYLILEYEEGGSLKNLLKERKIDDIQKMIILYGISKGIQFIHNIPICHRDINPKNIVLNSHLYPLICDFGLSRIFSKVHVVDGTQTGTPAYESPEMMTDVDLKSDCFLPSDIFSFGTVIYNLITNKEPYEDEFEESRRTSYNIGIFLKKGKRIKLDDSIPSWFRYLITLCWKQDPYERPTIGDVVYLFDAGIAFSLVYEDENGRKEYFDYINKYLHLPAPEMNENTLLEWRDKHLLKDKKEELALVIDFMLADHFKNSDSQTKLGYYYFNGYLVDKDYDKSLSYLKSAAEQNNAKSLFYLSEIYRHGLAEAKIEVDLNEANQLVHESESHGYEQAIQYLAKEKEFKDISKENAPTVVVVGSNGVGKTSFISSIMNIQEPLLFPTTESKTRDYFLPITLQINQKMYICLQDTSDIKDLSNVSKNPDLVFILFDRTNEQSFLQLDECNNLIREHIISKPKFIILGNKTDLNADKIPNSDANEKAQSFDASYYEISSLTSFNIYLINNKIKSYFSKLNSNVSENQIVVTHLKNTNINESGHLIRSLILGSSGCGKTSFIKYLENDKSETSPSVSPTPVTIDLDLVSLQVMDTVGQEINGSPSILPAFIKCETLFIIMFDITSTSSFNDVNNFYELIDHNVSSNNFKILIFGNKDDEAGKREVSSNEAENKAKSFGAEYIEISCKTGHNIDEAVKKIKDADELLTKGSNNANKILPLDQTRKKCSCK